MKEKRVTKLACGGKGPCCHIGYPHRHCEHCDVVISLHQCYPQPWYQPLRPYWSGATTSMPPSIGNLQASAAQQLQPAASLPTPDLAAALENGHTCEAK